MNEAVQCPAEHSRLPAAEETEARRQAAVPAGSRRHPGAGLAGGGTARPAPAPVSSCKLDRGVEMTRFMGQTYICPSLPYYPGIQGVPQQPPPHPTVVTCSRRSNRIPFQALALISSLQLLISLHSGY